MSTLDALIQAAPAPAIAHTLARLERVLELPDKERTELLDALRAWYTTDTAEEAAGHLRCSESTLKRRLRRIDELTGRPRTTHTDRAELLIALKTLRLYGDNTGTLARLMGRRMHLGAAKACCPGPDETHLVLVTLDARVAAPEHGIVAYPDARDIAAKLKALENVDAAVTVHAIYRDTNGRDQHTTHAVTRTSAETLRQQLINARCC